MTRLRTTTISEKPTRSNRCDGDGTVEEEEVLVETGARLTAFRRSLSPA